MSKNSFAYTCTNLAGFGSGCNDAECNVQNLWFFTHRRSKNETLFLSIESFDVSDSSNVFCFTLTVSLLKGFLRALSHFICHGHYEDVLEEGGADSLSVSNATNIRLKSFMSSKMKRDSRLCANWNYFYDYQRQKMDKKKSTFMIFNLTKQAAINNENTFFIHFTF